MNKYICIHGHFYQPPRENPWLEAIEMQDSAYPYHDWNERITAECYAPNSASRILNEQQEITQIVNNYQNISFNFGPTLLAWIREWHPNLLQKIIEADANSKSQFQGHGAAIAQAYNHIILPLANTRDRYTQIYWGIRHFELYFKRKPEGLWLPETAVDLATLDILAQAGIQFTILAPNQAHRVRKLDSLHWHTVSPDKIDISMPYIQKLPSGRSIAVFFYAGPTSRAIAFEHLLQNGNEFANRLIDLCSSSRAHAQLIHIATDGETYGHHHHFGDMALAYALHYIKEQGIAEVTVYAQFLAAYPPTHEVEIFENSSWSCAHGIERWKADCGCNSGQHVGWQQAWRAPLRNSLDWLRDTLIPLYEEHAGKYLKDPWLARNEYIDIINDRSAESLADFLDKHAIRELTDPEIEQLLKTLEMQRHALLMYTSCGWFFDEISGIETVQVMQYAARAIQLAESLSQQDYETEFLKLLALAPSNIPGYENGRKIYELFVKTTRFELPAVTAHYAISSLFKEYQETSDIYCYSVRKIFEKTSEAGKITLKIGSVLVISNITYESIHTDYALIHYGDQNLRCGVRLFQDDAAYKTMEQTLLQNFSQGDFLEIPKLLENFFGMPLYTIKNLFRDEQRNVINEILKLPLSEAETMYRFFYENHASIMNYVNNLSIPLPRPLHKTVEYVLNSNLKQALEEDILDIDRLQQLYADAQKFHTEFYTSEIEYLFQKKLEAVFKIFQENPFNEALLQKLIRLLDIVNKLHLDVKLWRVQNIVYKLSTEDKIKNQTDAAYTDLFRQLLQQLKMDEGILT